MKRVMQYIDKLRAFGRRVDRLSGGVFTIIGETLRSFRDARASNVAAGLAYYVLFSLFPLLLLFVVVASRFLESETAFQKAVTFVSGAIPISTRLIEKNLQTVLDLRGTVGLVGAVGALWSASKAFAMLAQSVNRAWQAAESRGFLKQRLVALAMVGVLISLLLLSLVSTTALRLLPRLELPVLGIDIAVFESTFWPIASHLVPLIFTWLMFLALYRWIPNTTVRWKSALWGASVAALGWELAKGGFAWYLSSGLARYEVVYGSLGTVVALLFWIYISGLVTLWGAHFSATLDHKGK